MGSTRWILGEKEHEWHLALPERGDTHLIWYAIQEQLDLLPSYSRMIIINQNRNILIKQTNELITIILSKFLIIIPINIYTHGVLGFWGFGVLGFRV